MSLSRYQGVELSLQRAESIAPAWYAGAYEWFIKHEGRIVPLPYGRETPPKIGKPLAAQRGIHKPGGESYALSIKSTGNMTYSDDRLYELEDGTWMLRYCAHHRNAGETEGSPAYNRSLLRCLHDGIPVGVLLKVPRGGYLCKGLAYLESYDSSTDLFMLHGPVRADNEPSDFSPAAIGQSDAAGSFDFPSAEPTWALEFDSGEVAQEDRRKHVVAEMVRREGQRIFRAELLRAYGGACAVTRYHAEPALQAAHIMSYLGAASQMVTNGLLLRADIHLLYDRFLLAVDPDGYRIRIASDLRSTEYDELDGREIALPKDPLLHPSMQRLGAKYQEFLAVNGEEK